MGKFILEVPTRTELNLLKALKTFRNEFGIFLPPVEFVDLVELMIEALEENNGRS